MRPRADDRHVAHQHVEDLRQLVDAGAADEGADAGDAVIIARGRTVAVVIEPFDAHRAELVHVEELVAASQASLDEQHRAAVLELDQRRDHQQQRRQDDQRCAGYQRVESALDDPRAQPQRAGRHHQRGAVEIVVAMHPDRAEAMRRFAYDLAIDARRLEQESPVLAPFARAAHHHVVLIAQQLAQPVEHEGVVAARVEVEFRRRDDHGIGIGEARSAVVDHQMVGDPSVPAPLDQAPHRPAHRHQHDRGEQQPQRHRRAREILVGLGVEGDEVDEAGRNHHRDHGLAGGVQPIGQRLQPVGAIIQRNRVIGGQHRLRGQHRARFGPAAFPHQTAQREREIEQDTVGQKDQGIGAQAPPLERRHQLLLDILVPDRFQKSRCHAIH